MRSFIISAAAIAFAFGYVTAQDFDNDYSSACQSVCGPIVTRADFCGDEFDDDDTKLNCVCTGPNMSNLIPQCQACMVSNNGDDDDEPEDINELVSRCNFATTTASPTSSGSPQVTVYTTTEMETDDDSDDLETETITAAIATTTNASGQTSVVTSAAAGATGVVGDGDDGNDGGDDVPETNFAVVTTVPLLGAGIGAAVGVLLAL